MTAYNIVNSTSLVAGQPEDVSQVLANLQAIQTVLNGNIDGTNLKNYPSDGTKALFGDMSWKVVAPVLGADLVAANTITATNQLHRISGTTVIKTINGGSSVGTLTLLTTGNGVNFDLTGNLLLGSYSVFFLPANQSATFAWDSTASKWYLVNTSAPAGTEIGYDTMPGGTVTIASTTEATPTTLFTCAAHTFDGGPVLAHINITSITPGSTAGAGVFVNLFEGSTNLGRVLVVTPESATTGGRSLAGQFRFTPTAGNHTYIVAAWNTGTGSPSATSGAGGSGAYDPVFIRFLKV